MIAEDVLPVPKRFRIVFFLLYLNHSLFRGRFPLATSAIIALARLMD
jgi:hypothetical protein